MLPDTSGCHSELYLSSSSVLSLHPGLSEGKQLSISVKLDPDDNRFNCGPVHNGQDAPVVQRGCVDEPMADSIL